MEVGGVQLFAGSPGNIGTKALEVSAARLASKLPHPAIPDAIKSEAISPDKPGNPVAALKVLNNGLKAAA